jgi:predicted  nucleic acid-binding Zn-ribbon protein
MHPDLPRLLDLQTKDQHLASLSAQKRTLLAERMALDAVLERHRNEVASAKRTADEMAQRRDTMATSLETQRLKQEKRRERLDTERTPRVAAQLLADLEMARGILSQEETDWLRLAEDVGSRQAGVAEHESHLAAAGSEQAEARAAIATRLEALEVDVNVAQREREAAASHLDKTLRGRYDRLRSSRKVEVVVPVDRGSCTACYTSIPSSRLGPLHADGVLLDGCPNCGAIIYLLEAVR